MMEVFNGRDDDGRSSCGLLLRQGVFQDGSPENLKKMDVPTPFLYGDDNQ